MLVLKLPPFSPHLHRKGKKCGNFKTNIFSQVRVCSYIQLIACQFTVSLCINTYFIKSCIFTDHYSVQYGQFCLGKYSISQDFNQIMAIDICSRYCIVQYTIVWRRHFKSDSLAIWDRKDVNCLRCKTRSQEPDMLPFLPIYRFNQNKPSGA